MGKKRVTKTYVDDQRWVQWLLNQNLRGAANTSDTKKELDDSSQSRKSNLKTRSFSRLYVHRTTYLKQPSARLSVAVCGPIMWFTELLSSPVCTNRCSPWGKKSPTVDLTLWYLPGSKGGPPSEIQGAHDPGCLTHLSFCKTDLTCQHRAIQFTTHLC